MIAIIDYGMGNIHSVQKALEVAGARTCLTSDPDDIARADKLVLPGVGAFDDAMQELDNRGLSPVLRDQAEKKPFLGICLGLQLLFDESEEALKSKGLGIVRGQVKRFIASGERKVPHMGWNQLQAKKSECPLLAGIAGGAFVYFCHSYYPEPSEGLVTAATCDYGVSFSALVWKNTVYGAQFHPEKSQAVGLAILRNFVNL